MSKFKNRNGTPEVHSARSKLDGLLQTLVTKKDDSFTENPDTEESEEASVTTPTKKTFTLRHGRKRKRGRDDMPSGPEVAQYHHTYVMKLFDRSVDLAQFDDDSPLYPICRAWMRNQPHNRTLGPRDRSPTPEPEAPLTFDDEDEVYSLPSPILVKHEPGYHQQDKRIPTPEPQPDEILDIHADPDQAPAPEQILLNHMVRWKAVRQRWKQAGFRRESQYAASLEILRNMYERQYKDQ